jgi:predicted SnoaL-like aldol condensation-catalyzing enzyme
MINKYLRAPLVLGAMILCFNQISFAQAVPRVTPAQKTMLQSQDPQLAANKKIVYDFWREVIEAGHLDLAPQFLTETYFQHNPNVPSGRQGFIDFFSKFSKESPIVDSVRSPLIAMVAESDLVVLVFKFELPDPKDPSKRYTTTGFDMLRIEGGKIAEHWDASTKQ